MGDEFITSANQVEDIFKSLDSQDGQKQNPEKLFDTRQLCLVMDHLDYDIQ